MPEGSFRARWSATSPEWLRKGAPDGKVDRVICSGALILCAAGILKGQPATTHWYKMGVLRIMGAKPKADERVVRSGTVLTAGGASTGIDLALWLAGEIARGEQAEAIRLVIEHDPHPPYYAGHMSKASKDVERPAKVDDSIPPISAGSFPRSPGSVYRPRPHGAIAPGPDGA